MGQNLAAQVALLNGGGVGFLNLDASGNLKVALAASPEGSLPVTIAEGADAAQGSQTDAAVSTAANASLIALLKGLQTPLNYKGQAVAASSTATVLGTTGAAGDILASLLLVPAAAACGVVSLLDGATTLWTFPGGGTTALPSLAPVPLNMQNVRATTAWKITTGANVAVYAIGKFT
jgi:hypothetical protein